jgi:hypothetical protein
MCSKSASEHVEAAGFRPDAKCCTYHPTLPNFLVGAVLSDTSSAGERAREVVRAKIARRIGVTPRWLAAPRKYMLMFEATRLSSFGRSDALLCPYFLRESGQCGIWRHREVVCATFFCKYSSGALGHAFWRAVKNLVRDVEARLAEQLANAVGPGTSEPSVPRGQLTLEDLEDRPPDAYSRIWGEWEGREEDFYIECARRASALTPEEAAKALEHQRSGALEEEVRTLYDRLARPELAPRLALNPHLAVERARDGVGVTSYSRYDSLFLSDALYRALGKFTHDEPVDTVLDRLREEGIDLPRSLLLQLQLHGIVVPAKEEGD